VPKGAQGTLSASSAQGAPSNSAQGAPSAQGALRTLRAQGAPSNSAYGAQSNSEGGCDALPALLHSVAMGVDSNSEMTV